MLYTEASALGKIRAMAAYMGVMVWDGLGGGGTLSTDGTTDADKWFAGTFTEEDAARVLPEWERDTREYAGQFKDPLTLEQQLEDDYQLSLGMSHVEPAANREE